MFGSIDFAKLELMDALDLAVLIEVEALERYQMFVEQLGYTGPGDPCSIFRSMAQAEGKHASDLSDRRKALFGDAPMRVSRDDIYDVEAPDHGAPKWNMSPLAALEVALAAEKKAFVFYDRALQQAQNGPVQELFTELRDEETEHVRLVTRAIAALPPGSDQELEDLDED
jgi:rubrerythrin